MGLIRKFESAMQGAIEGSFGRVFRTRLQPVELARKLERAMEDHLTITSDRRIAPNVYDVYLSSKDYAQFEPNARSQAQQLSEALIRVARDRRYTLTTRPLIRFHEDARLVTGQVRIETQRLEPQTAEGDTPGGKPMGDETQAMSPVELRELEQEINRAASQPSTSNMPPAWLTLYRPVRGQPLRLDRPIVHLGRHLSNDIVVNDRRVSRYHAEIRFEHGQFFLYDLGSTNGVRVNGVPIRQAVPLRNNDIISMGSHEFIFQRR
ncbi:MAG: FHA domain-containing protein [Ktedonobacterales bacterium]|nr:FHA domain-containing protein [Ktedonobacterales bacterium]